MLFIQLYFKAPFYNIVDFGVLFPTCQVLMLWVGHLSYKKKRKEDKLRKGKKNK